MARTTFRLLAVLMIGALTGAALYLVADRTFRSPGGGFGFSPNFITLIEVWRAAGGSARPLDGSQGGFGSAPPFGGGPPFGGFGGAAFDDGTLGVPLAEGLDPSRVPSQTGSDLFRLGLPALGAVLFEIAWTSSLRRRRREA